MKNKTLEIKYLKVNGSKGLCILAGINRVIRPSHVTTMARSIEKMGVIRPVVVANIDFITGSRTTYIIDGQHLYHALIRAGIDIPYTEIVIKDNVDLAEHLALLNNSSKSWSMLDYITVWANVNKDYIKLNKFYNTYDVELCQLADMLMNNSCTFYSGGAGSISRVIKRGDFKIDDEKRAVFLLNCVTDALKIVKRMDRMSNKLFIATYVNFMNTTENYNHKQFMANLKLNKDKFVAITQDPEEYKKLLKSII